MDDANPYEASRSEGDASSNEEADAGLEGSLIARSRGYMVLLALAGYALAFLWFQQTYIAFVLLRSVLVDHFDDEYEGHWPWMAVLFGLRLVGGIFCCVASQLLWNWAVAIREYHADRCDSVKVLTSQLWFWRAVAATFLVLVLHLLWQILFSYFVVNDY